MSSRRIGPPRSTRRTSSASRGRSTRSPATIHCSGASTLVITRRDMLVTGGFVVLAGMERVPVQTSEQPKEANMDIKRGGSQPSAKGPAEYFTGSVRIDPLFQAPEPARVAGAHVTFEPG